MMLARSELMMMWIRSEVSYYMPFYVVVRDKDGRLITRYGPLFAAFEIFYTVEDVIFSIACESKVESARFDHPYFPLRGVVVTSEGVYLIDVEYEER